MFPVLDHNVHGLNPAGGGFQHMTVWCFFEQTISSPSGYSLNKSRVERKTSVSQMVVFPQT